MTSVGDVTTLAPSLGDKCLSEFLGTTIGIYLGCSVIANALLPGAKGQSMGFGWIALGYGLAFFLPGVFFGHISANLNPAVCLADWILGNSSVAEFFALSGAEIAGGIAGGILVWIHWLPHFKTVPEPPATNAGDNLLRKRDALPKAAVEIASYNPRPTGPAAAAAAAAHMQAAGTGTLAASGTLRRRRRTGDTSDIGSSLPISQAQGQGGRIGSGRFGSGRVGSGVAPGAQGRTSSGVLAATEAELKAALEKQKQLAKDVSKKVKRGVGGTIREWFVDFMYYAVHHDTYHKPEDWRPKQPPASQVGRTSHRSDQTPGTPNMAQRYTSIHNGEEMDGAVGRLDPVMEDEESGFQSMRRQATQNAGGTGQANGNANGNTNGNNNNGDNSEPWLDNSDSDWSPADDRVTMSTLVRSYQQETLEAHVKLLAPGLYYTSAALSNGAAPSTSAAPPLASVGRTSNLGHSTRRQQELEAAAAAAVAAAGPNAAAADQSSEPARLARAGSAAQAPHPAREDSPPLNGTSVTSDTSPTPSQSPFDSLAHEPFAGDMRELNAGETGPLSAVLNQQPPDDATALAAAAAVPGMMKTALQQEIAGTAGGPEGEVPGGVAANANAVAFTALDEERQRVMALYQAAIIADQNAKLSVFTTRPAIFAPPFNWLTEFMSTVMLVLCVKLMAAQMLRQGLPGQVLQPLYVGFFIICAVLGLGGPTGFSVNPARDLGPRIAHAILPIPNKGPSEWWYGWIPVTASLAGGAAGAGLFMAINLRIW